MEEASVIVRYALQNHYRLYSRKSQCKVSRCHRAENRAAAAR